MYYFAPANGNNNYNNTNFNVPYFLAYRPCLELENKMIKSSIRLICAKKKIYMNFVPCEMP